MISKKKLYRWCSIPMDELEDHPDLVIKFQLAADSDDLGKKMAIEFAKEINLAGAIGKTFRAIVPCGPKSWYKPFSDYVNANNISLKHVEIFHMDECLDWQGQLLAPNDPYNFKTFMLKHFYAPIREDLSIKEENRNFLSPSTMEEVRAKINSAPIDYTIGGWGQDGHVAYNQSRRNPYSQITLDELKGSTIRIQENNMDTVIALAHRTYGAAYQFVPPMSITLGLKECMSAKKIRVYSDTGAWKMTALRIALFSKADVEYPMTLLQTHPDAEIIATKETANHPISHHPEWEFKGINI